MAGLRLPPLLSFTLTIVPVREGNEGQKQSYSDANGERQTLWKQLSEGDNDDETDSPPEAEPNQASKDIPAYPIQIDVHEPEYQSLSEKYALLFIPLAAR